MVVGVVLAETSCSPKHSTCIDGVCGDPCTSPQCHNTNITAQSTREHQQDSNPNPHSNQGPLLQPIPPSTPNNQDMRQRKREPESALTRERERATEGEIGATEGGIGARHRDCNQQGHTSTSSKLTHLNKGHTQFTQDKQASKPEVQTRVSRNSRGITLHTARRLAQMRASEQGKHESNTHQHGGEDRRQGAEIFRAHERPSNLLLFRHKVQDGTEWNKTAQNGTRRTPTHTTTTPPHTRQNNISVKVTEERQGPAGKGAGSERWSANGRAAEHLPGPAAVHTNIRLGDLKSAVC